MTCKWLTSYGENIVESAENVKLAQRLRRFIDQMAKSDAGRKLIREITTLIVQLKRIAEKIAAYNSHRGRSNMPYLRRCPHETEALFPENLIITQFPRPLISSGLCFALPSKIRKFNLNLFSSLKGEVENLKKSDTFSLIKQVPALEVARQLTLVAHEMLRRIKHTELLSRKWEDCRHAPNLYMFIKFGEQVATWANTEIVKGATVADRAITISFFIDLCSVCYLYFS